MFGSGMHRGDRLIGQYESGARLVERRDGSRVVIEKVPLVRRMAKPAIALTILGGASWVSYDVVTHDEAKLVDIEQPTNPIEAPVDDVAYLINMIAE